MKQDIDPIGGSTENVIRMYYFCPKKLRNLYLTTAKSPLRCTKILFIWKKRQIWFFFLIWSPCQMRCHAPLKLPLILGPIYNWPVSRINREVSEWLSLSAEPDSVEASEPRGEEELEEFLRRSAHLRELSTGNMFLCQSQLSWNCSL